MRSTWRHVFQTIYVSIKNADTKETEGTLFLWEADTSAAILFKGGGACMQTALAIKTTDLEAKAKISDAILQLADAAKQTTSSDSTTIDKEALADVSASIKEAAQSLTTTTERTAFLNMGMFYICQISANQSLSKNETNKAIIQLIKSASNMNIVALENPK